MTLEERSSLLQKAEVLCAELERDDRDLGEILFSMTEDIHGEENDRVPIHETLLP
jgi:hypothetical protein